MLDPDPAMAPGLIIQAPAGKTVKITLPVLTEHEGGVIVPTVGAGGVKGWALIITFADAGEIHPEALVTVKVCVPAVMPETVVLAPDPEIAPGLMVQLPAGNPDNPTLPVATEQVGCTMAPTTGADGVKGCVLITIFAENAEIQPAAFVTV